MRKTFILFALAALSFSGARLAAQTSGGPDAFGYTWKDSREGTGPVYNWVDISSRGTATRVTGLSDDNAVGMFNMGWSFRYYWSDFNQVRIGSNGWVAFNNIGNIASCFPTIPTQGGAGDNYVAGYMTDITFAGSGNLGQVWYWSNNVDSFIVQYKNVPNWVNVAPLYWAGSNSFEFIFSGVDSSITLQYQTLDAANLSNTGCAFDLITGIENITGNLGLQCNSGDTVQITPYAIKFYYPANSAFQIQDATPLWVGNTDAQGQFILANQPLNLQAGIQNAGNTAIPSGTDVRAIGKLQNLALITIFQDTQTVTTGLTPLQVQTVTYDPYTITSAGQYSFEVTTNCTVDPNPSNDKKKIEVSAITVGSAPACAHQYTYCTGQPWDGFITWSGGSGGTGMKVVPPAYPVSIVSAEALVFNTTDTTQSTPCPNGFIMEIWSEDTNGNPGVKLAADTVDAADVLNNQWNTATFATPVQITSGGFFVAWMQGGDSIGIGTETLNPISRRTYEILGPGSWAPYRSLASEDFLLRVNAEGCISVGANEILSNDYKLTAFPNPASTIVNIGFEVPEVSNIKLSMMNMQGVTLFSNDYQNVSAGSHQLPVRIENLAAGIYFINMETGGKMLNRKIVVTK